MVAKGRMQRTGVCFCSSCERHMLLEHANGKREGAAVRERQQPSTHTSGRGTQVR